MVRYIKLGIPPGLEDVYNPIEDSALMARIGAKRICDSAIIGTEVVVGSCYELKNEATGTHFRILWHQSSELQHSFFSLERRK